MSVELPHLQGLVSTEHDVIMANILKHTVHVFLREIFDLAYNRGRPLYKVGFIEHLSFTGIVLTIFMYD